MIHHPPKFTLFPYTTLFRSVPILVAGFSFGAWVGLRVGCEHRRVSHLIGLGIDRKSTRLNSSHGYISYAVFCLKKKNVDYLKSCVELNGTRVYESVRFVCRC